MQALLKKDVSGNAQPETSFIFLFFLLNITVFHHNLNKYEQIIIYAKRIDIRKTFYHFFERLNHIQRSNMIMH